MIVAALLEVEGLTVIHQGDRGSRQILDGVGFRLGDGETLGLVGESGSGKSVLLSAITGLLRPPWRVSEGHVRFRGRELIGLPEAEFRRVRGRELGLALANPRQHLNPILPIGRQLANVVSAHRRCRRAEAVALAVGLLRSVGIPDPARRLTAYPHELSGGMCQRLILALAIAHSPCLMLVDEPTSGLDVTISAQILDLLRKAVRTLHSGLLVVSRDLAVVAHYCERVLVLQSGRIVEESPVRDFFAAPRQPYSRQLLKAAAASRDADRIGSATEPVPARLGRAAIISDASPGGAAVLRIDGLVKRFPTRGGKLLTAVNGVSFAIRPGEALGLVGESGSGKTTVGRCVLRLIEPNAGTIRFRGRDVTHLAAGEFRKLRSRLQMVFQDPFDSTDPRQRIGDAIIEPLRLTGRSDLRQRRARLEEMLDLVGLDRRCMNHYPHELSAGQLQRVGIARALATEPDLVVFDEPTSALDVSVRAEILNLLRDLQRRIDVAYLFISHDLTAVRRLCHRTAVLYLGKIVEIGETESLFEAPLHPYSRALLSSVLYPDPDQVLTPLALSGEIPSPIDQPSGCSLHPRCPLASAACADIVPRLEEKRPGRRLACINVEAEGVPERELDQETDPK
jgi:oligopeptide/dipeptide ABC transporter ATP-binding protein